MAPPRHVYSENKSLRQLLRPLLLPCLTSNRKRNSATFLLDSSLAFSGELNPSYPARLLYQPWPARDGCFHLFSNSCPKYVSRRIVAWHHPAVAGPGRRGQVVLDQGNRAYQMHRAGARRGEERSLQVPGLGVYSAAPVCCAPFAKVVGGEGKSVGPGGMRVGAGVGMYGRGHGGATFANGRKKQIRSRQETFSKRYLRKCSTLVLAPAQRLVRQPGHPCVPEDTTPD